MYPTAEGRWHANCGVPMTATYHIRQIQCGPAVASKYQRKMAAITRVGNLSASITELQLNQVLGRI